MIRGSLRRRLFLLVLLAVIPAFVLHVTVQVAHDMGAAQTRVAAASRDLAAAITPLLESSLVVGDLATVQETLDNVMGQGHFRTLRLMDAGGERQLVAGHTHRTMDGASTPAWFTAWLGIRFPEFRFPVNVGGTTYAVLVAEPAAGFLATDIWQRLWTAILLWSATLALGLVLLDHLLRRSLQPLEELGKAAHRLGEGDLDCRAPVGDVPELAATARAFNRMADKLAEANARQEERIREATRELENLIARIPAGVYKMRMLAGGGVRFDYVSPRWCELLELTAEEAYREPALALTRLHPEEQDAFLRLNEEAMAGPTPLRWEGRLREGLRARWICIEATPTPLDNGDILWNGIQYDISTTKAREAELDQIAHFDSLTGVPNRVLLADRLRQALAQAERAETTLAVCYLDLDGFKPVNDALGHEAGDALLVEIARRLQGAVRAGDTVARMGGDEFVLLLAGMSRVEDNDDALQRILDAVQAPFTMAGQRIAVSASMGVALHPGDQTDPDLLLRHADQAMYLAKQAGRGRFVYFDPRMEESARQHRILLQQVRTGLAGNQFELYFEPKVNLRLGAVAGFEALLRWRHPDKGLLLPRDFLPLIEDHELMLALDDWVLDGALSQLDAWRRRGIDLPLSVNVAARQLLRGDFPTRLRQRLARHDGVPPERLEIEVLEAEALADTARLAQVIRECRQLGVGFALDDFGTGYSSLTYLKQVPAQTLKIDQSFVRDMLTDANDLAIVEGVIGLTDVFRRQVIAEGVETARHCALLLRLGCELAQGHGIARPMPASQVDAWLATWRPDPTWQSAGETDWPREELTLLVAENNHLAWVDALTSFLDGHAPEPPEDDPARCRFGLWLSGHGRGRYGGLPAYQAVGELHDRIHELGRQLIALAQAGKRGEARARLPELHGLRTRLLDQLRKLKDSAGSPR
ncbi:MAG: EAL domain-containing protein [Pseudomonadota bacterium]